jgi:hypothetical protein
MASIEQNSKSPQNELQIDNAWQAEIVNRLIAPLLECEFDNRIVFIEHDNPVAVAIQHCAHVDAVATYQRTQISIEIKTVRFPGAKRGMPWRFHYKDFFLETHSSTVYNSPGWMKTSQADILFWGQVDLTETAVTCFPLPFDNLRKWAREHWAELVEKERLVENIIDGRSLWTKGVLANIRQVCRDLHVAPFRIHLNKLITDDRGRTLLPLRYTAMQVAQIDRLRNNY